MVYVKGLSLSVEFGRVVQPSWNGGGPYLPEGVGSEDPGVQGLQVSQQVWHSL